MTEGTGMNLPIVHRLRTFSPEHCRYVDTILSCILRHYGENLLGLAIFGSFARGENRKDSDLDLLMILRDARKRRIRIEELIREVEMKHDDLAQRLFREEGLSCELSPYIVTETEALMMQPIYYDLVTDHVIVWDPEGIIDRIINSASALLKEVGAYRVRRNNTWEWRTNRFLGGIGL